jgi:integrase/recombinase XerD
MDSGLLVTDDHHSSSTGLAVRRHESNAAMVYLVSLTSAESRRTMLRSLDQIASLLTSGEQDAVALNWGAVRVEHTAFVRTQLIEDGYAPATINVILSALRGVLRAAWHLRQMTSDDYRRARDVKNVTSVVLPAGRDLKQGEIHGLMAVCADDDSPAGVRDAAIIAVLYTCGLRRSELTALDLADVDLDSGRIEVKSGKGRKARTVYAANGALDALKDWIGVRGDDPGALYCPINKGGKIALGASGKGMTSQAIYNMLRKRAKQAGISDFSPHDFRRTFVGDLLDRGADIATVQQLAGHANVNTTSRYDRRGEETKRIAAQKLHVPYISRLAIQQEE